MTDSRNRTGTDDVGGIYEVDLSTNLHRKALEEYVELEFEHMATVSSVWIDRRVLLPTPLGSSYSANFLTIGYTGIAPADPPNL